MAGQQGPHVEATTGRRVSRRQFLQAGAAAGGAGLVAGGAAGFFAARATEKKETGPGVVGGAPIKIGASLPLTEWGAAEGELEQAAMELAVEEINANGGVLGRQLELVILDCGDMSPERVVSTFQTLIDREGVHGIAGGWYLFTGPEYDVVAETGTPFLHVNTQEANAETERADPDKYWMCLQCDPTEVWYGRGFPSFLDGLIAKRLYEPQNKKIAIIAASDPYGSRIANEVRPAMEDYGWTVSLFETVVAPISEWGPVLAKIRQDPPDIIFNTDVSVPDIAAFATQFAQNPTQSLVYGQYGPSQPQYKELAGNAANGVIWSVMISLPPSPIVDQHLAKWTNKYPNLEPGLGAAGFSYDMTYLLANGIALAGDPDDSRGIMDAIRRTPWRGISGTYVFTHDYEELRTPPPYPDWVDDPSMGIPHSYLQIQNLKDEFIAPTPYETSEFQVPPWF